MTDIPIIFSAAMIRALLNGHKTMTRRLLYIKRKARNGVVLGSATFLHDHPPPRGKLGPEGFPTDIAVGEYWTLSPWQRVKPGDRLWVRETWQWSKIASIPPLKARWASRLTLIVTATKIERLQEISEEDAKAEGVQHRWLKSATCAPRSHYFIDAGNSIEHSGSSGKEAFERLWDKLHGPGSWDANPEVVAISFETVKANIDAPILTHMPEKTR